MENVNNAKKIRDAIVEQVGASYCIKKITPVEIDSNLCAAADVVVQGSNRQIYRVLIMPFNVKRILDEEYFI